MMCESLNVGIVGFGTTGPAAALFLQGMGHRVTIFEQAKVCEPVGAGFMLQPSGMMVVDALGLLDTVEKHAAKIEGLHIGNHRNQSELLDLKYESVLPGGYALGLHRSVLISALLEESNKYSSINICWGAEIETIDADKGLIIERSGEKHGEFDLVIIADGANSSTRASLGLKEKVKRYQWGALWWMQPDERGVFDHTRLDQVVDGTGYLAGFLPTGKAWQEIDSASSYISLFWSVPVDRRRWCFNSIGQWKEEVLRLFPKSEAYIEPLSSLDELRFTSYYDVRMRSWHRKRGVVLGDAAHAMSPQLGQGVNLGLLDAKILCESIAGESSVEEALQLYSRRRCANLRYYQFATRWITPFFQSSYEWLTPFRDLGFPMTRRFPWVRNQMISTMMGVKGGFLNEDREISEKVRALLW